MSGFKIDTKKEESVSVVRISGFLDAHTAHELEAEFQGITSKGDYKILVNFAGLDYISSAGLGVFMGFIELVRENGGDIKMCEMNVKIYKIFDLLGFPNLYEIFDTQAEAIEKFKD
ncbi:STAS domain-containing protein [bacterium]|nr:STAS domain-containing protein [bacterium]